MRREVVMVMVAVSVLSLSACDPSGPASRDTVILQISVNADGSGAADMFLDDRTHSDAQLNAWGDAVGSRLFPRATSLTVVIDPNRGGHPYVAIHALGLYRPGPHPQVSLDSRDAVTWMLSNGTKTVDVYLDCPVVPVSSTWTPARAADDGSWAWSRISARSMAPVGVIEMSPRPWLGALPVLLALIALAGLVGSFIMFRRRRRALAMLLLGGAPAALVFDVMQAGGVLPDNLGVAGLLSGTGVAVASGVAMAPLLQVPVALVLLLIYATAPQSRPPLVFHPPPS